MKRTVFVLALMMAACGAKKSSAPNDVKSGKSAEPVWLVHDNGKRCIVAPCPSWTAVNVDSRESVEVATIDLSALKLAPKEEAEGRQKVQAGQTWARGTIVTVEKAGPAGAAKVLTVTALVDATGKSVQTP